MRITEQIECGRFGRGDHAFSYFNNISVLSFWNVEREIKAFPKKKKLVGGGSKSFSLFHLTGVALKDKEAEGQLRTTERASGAE